MFVIGDTIWAYYENVLGVKSPFPSAADGFYLAGYPFLATGLAYMAGFRAQWRARSQPDRHGDCRGGAGLISWVFFIEPYAYDPPAAWRASDLHLLSARRRVAGYSSGGVALQARPVQARLLPPCLESRAFPDHGHLLCPTGSYERL